jgi:hypothetical protein
MSVQSRDRGALLWSCVGLSIALIAFVVCVWIGVPLLIPIVYLAALIGVKRPGSKSYLTLLASYCALVAILAGLTYSYSARQPIAQGAVIACGLVLATIGRLRAVSPPSDRR